MKLIDITNSHSQLVNEQLANTDAHFIKVYSLGQTTVIYSGAPTHQDLLILNKKRRIKEDEITFSVKKLLEKDHWKDLDIIQSNHFIEISIPVVEPRPTFSKVE